MSFKNALTVFCLLMSSAAFNASASPMTNEINLEGVSFNDLGLKLFLQSVTLNQHKNLPST